MHQLELVTANPTTPPPQMLPMPMLQLGVHASAAWHPAPYLEGVAGPLLPAWRRVAGVFAPLLHPRGMGVELRSSALVVGPRGSGARTAVRGAAAALGLNYVTWSCYDIRVRGRVRQQGREELGMQGAEGGSRGSPARKGVGDN